MLPGSVKWSPPTVDTHPRTLAVVLDLEEMKRHLRQLVYTHWRAHCVIDVKTRLLKLQSGNRCTVEIAVRTERGWHYLIGKVYWRDRGDLFEAMKKIWESGLNGEEEFSIPRPIAYLPSLRLLLLEKAEGVLAKCVFLEGNPSQCAETAERCALWLTRFQALAPRQGKIMDLQRIQRHGERRVRFIFEARMPFASKARKLFERLAAAPPALDVMCAGHGDYKPEHQFLLPQGNVITFGWDCYDIADPCRDAAMFLIYLERIGLEGFGALRKLESASQVFLKTYAAAPQSGVEARLRFHKAALYLQEAKFDVGEQQPGWFQRSEIMLDRGLQAFEP